VIHCEPAVTPPMTQFAKFFSIAIARAKSQARQPLALLICAVLAASLSIAPLDAQAKVKGKQTSSKKASFKSGKASKASASKHKVSKAAKAGKGGKGNKHRKGKIARVFVPAPPSVGMLNGLHSTPDPLSLKSGVALVVDANTSQVLLEKNAATALPIASITKLMTALVVVDAQQDMAERLTIGDSDVHLEMRARSRLGLGTEMSRRDALQLALMSSENRAANMLTRYYPGGKTAFVDAMNRKAAQLGMRQSYFVEGTGLASANVASAYDLVKLVKAAKQHPLLRELSTQSNYSLVDSAGHATNFHTTNRLIKNPGWDIELQKTGFINAAGQCLVMHTNLDGRSVIMVFLDSAGKLSRLGDAQRVRDWLSTNPVAAAPKAPAMSQRPPAAPVVLATHTAQLGFAAQHAQQMMAWSPK
jgi:serine-type D-Ala-D-Ala endopeptidase (penicillin-binding protein 7)